MRRHLFLVSFIVIALVIGCVVWLMRNTIVPTMMSPLSSVNLLSSGWNYMSGVTPGTHGLQVAYVGRAIVQQDGTPGQVNPAVNVYGTHLQMTGNFRLTATVQHRHGTAVLAFYADPPVIQDEFRVEPKGVSLALSDTSLTLTRSEGYTNQSLFHQLPAPISYPVSPGSATLLTVAQQGSKLQVSVNGRLLTTFATPFSRTVWFGLSAAQPMNTWTLTDLHAHAPQDAPVRAVDTTKSSITTQTASTTLQSLASAKRPGFLIGTAFALGPALSDGQYGSLAFGGNFGSITPENAMKWQFIQPQPTLYDFKEADAVVALARRYHIAVHGHALVFGEANPQWVQSLPTSTATDKDHVKRIMIDHITQVMTHFKGQVASWDVVNEPLAEDDSSSTPLRQHIWEKAMGEDYIAAAFTAAHQADPRAKLYLNDYGLEADGDRWNHLLSLVASLKQRHVPIDGIGMEAHVYEAGDKIDAATLQAHIRALATLGLTTRISEMDVYSSDGTTLQASQYADVLRTCITEPTCVSWTTWGITDRYDMYQNDNDSLSYGQDLLWDNRAYPTPAVGMVRQVLH